MSTGTWKRARRILAGTVVAGAALAGVATADILTVNDVAASGDASKQVGQTGTARFWLTNTQQSEDQGVNGCNASGSSPVVFNIVSSNTDAVTLAATTVSIAACDDPATPAREGAVSVQYTAAGVGDSIISAAYASGGKSDARMASAYNTQDTLRVAVSSATPPTPSDTTAPVLSPTIQGALGDNGWYTSNVKVTWAVSDAESTVSAQNGCGETNVTADTDGQTITCTATSAGGTSSQSVVIKRDTAAPSVLRDADNDSCDVPGDNGWCRGTQTAGFAATDGGSGLADTAQAAFTNSTTQNGSAVSIPSGAVRDRAGNVNSGVEASPFQIDSTAPAIQRDSSRDACSLAGSDGWCRGTQTAGFAAGDDVSGLAVPGQSSFTKETTDNGSAVEIASGAVSDAAGNTASSINAGPFKIDSVAPALVHDTANDSCSDAGENGWCTGTQTAAFTASDATSGLAAGTPSAFSRSTAANGGEVTIASGAVSDAAGNTNAGIDAGPFKIDSRAPTVGTDPDADACSRDGSDGWCRGTQTAGFKASDAGSGLADPDQAAFTQSTTANGGEVKIASGSVADVAGNVNDGIEAGPFKIDSVAPALGRDSSRDDCSVPGNAGWCRGTQTAGFAASDATSGLANAAQSSFTEDTVENGAAVLIASGSVADVAGNTAGSIDAGPYKIDSVAPSITGSRSPQANADGWNNTNVTVSFTCGDGGSGLAGGACPADVPVTDEGRDQSVARSVTDVAGNWASDTVSDIDVDKTAPTAPAAGTQPAAPRSGDWFKDSVTVAYGGSTDPQLADQTAGSGVKGYSASQTFTTSGSHAYAGKATDGADNDSAATSGTVKVDATLPTVQITNCPTKVTLGSTRSVTVAAADAHSGLVSDPSGNVPLDTSAVGPKTKTVAVEDNVGHRASDSCSYTVVYDWANGFFQPIDNRDAAGGYVLNKAKAGSTIPVKFSLKGNQGLAILAAGYPSSAPITCSSTATNDVIEEYAPTGATSGLKYDAIADQYVYNWKTEATWAGKCRQLVVRLTEGTEHRASFTFVK